MRDTIRLLRKAGVQFRYYAQQHLSKTRGFKPGSVEYRNATLKSDINLRLAEEIDEHLLRIEAEAAPPSEEQMPQPVTE